MASFYPVFATGIILVLASNVNLASAESSTFLPDILLPSPNVTAGAVGEIKCYALPYGAIGIISHLLTYWTIAWTAVGHPPLWPFHQRMKHFQLDMFLAILALCTCIPIASITMHRCRLSWHFLLICIWKLITSVSLACITLHRCAIISETRQKGKEHRRVNPSYMELRPLHQQAVYPGPYHNSMYQQMPQVRNNSQFFSQSTSANTKEERNLRPLWWLVLYLCGTIVGMIGLCSLLYTTFRQDQTIRNLTYAFGAAMAIVPLLVVIYWYTVHLDSSDAGRQTHAGGGPSHAGRGEAYVGGRRAYFKAFWTSFGGAVVAFLAVFGVFSPLYSDLVLGSIAGNLFGLPSRDFAPLYWAWFVAKRLPMLSR